jgi:uncharacterized membrane protein
MANKPNVRENQQRLVMCAAMAAAVCVGTLLIRIPIPATGGYFNFGDAIIIVAGLLFGPVVGAVAGGIGSMAADLIGFPAFAVPTLVIKGVLGFIVGAFGHRAGIWRAGLAALAAEVWMITGYYVVERWVFAESMGEAAAAAELPFNGLQGLFGIIVGVTVWAGLRLRSTAQAKPSA